jgi:epoxyqueuosine reductase
MEYMGAHGSRSHPAELIPGTLRVVSLRMDYLPGDTQMAQRLAQPEKAYIALRPGPRLPQAGAQARAAPGRPHPGSHRPVRLPRLRRQRPGAGESPGRTGRPGLDRQEHLLLNRKAGSYFFLAELFVDLPLPVDEATSEHCGRCQACLDICPTQAFVGPMCWMRGAAFRT